MRFFLITFTSFLLASCSVISFQPTPTKDSKNYGSQEYQDCIDKNPSDKTKCEMIKPNTMEPNLTEHKDREGYH